MKYKNEIKRSINTATNLQVMQTREAAESHLMLIKAFTVSMSLLNDTPH